MFKRDKRTKTAIKMSEAATMEPVANKPGVDTAPKAAVAPEQQRPVDDTDDGDFIPVIPHGRKDRREKRNRNKDSKPPSTSSTGGKSTTSGSSRRRSRKHASDSAASAASSQNHQESSENNNGTTGDENSNDDTPKKFVEAPIPAVNVWKVCLRSLVLI